MHRAQPVFAVNGPTPDATPDRRLADLLLRSATAQQQKSSDDLAKIPGQIADLGRRLVLLDRALPAAARRLDELRHRPDMAVFASEEGGRIRALPGVNALEVDDRRVLVTTLPVLIPWRGNTYDLGTYRLALDLDGDVRVESIDRFGPRGAWDHPHVQDGLPCLGNLRPGVLKLVAEYELALATQVLLDFLGTYEPDSAYSPLEGWPVAS